jgi:hypothetical protein
MAAVGTPLPGLAARRKTALVVRTSASAGTLNQQQHQHQTGFDSPCSSASSLSFVERFNEKTSGHLLLARGGSRRTINNDSEDDDVFGTNGSGGTSGTARPHHHHHRRPLARSNPGSFKRGSGLPGTAGSGSGSSNFLAPPLASYASKDVVGDSDGRTQLRRISEDCKSGGEHADRRPSTAASSDDGGNDDHGRRRRTPTTSNCSPGNFVF